MGEAEGRTPSPDEPSYPDDGHVPWCPDVSAHAPGECPDLPGRVPS